MDAGYRMTLCREMEIEDYLVWLLEQPGGDRVDVRDLYLRGGELGSLLAAPAGESNRWGNLSQAASARLGLLLLIMERPRAHDSWWAYAHAYPAHLPVVAFWKAENNMTASPRDDAAKMWGLTRTFDITQVRRALRGEVL